MKKDYNSVEIIFLGHGLQNLLDKKNKNWSNDRCLRNLNLSIGIVNEDLFDLFGKFVDETEELSTDVYQCEEEEEEEFYDSLDLKIMDFKFASGPINNIIPLKNSQILFCLKKKELFMILISRKVID